MRRIGVAVLVFGVLDTVQSPLMAKFAKEFLVTEGLKIQSVVDPPYFYFLAGALILILAEIFRVGTELERRDA